VTELRLSTCDVTSLPDVDLYVEYDDGANAESVNKRNTKLTVVRINRQYAHFANVLFDEFYRSRCYDIAIKMLHHSM
jgi:hypothetical protein